MSQADKSRRAPSLEALLHLKRAERPDAAFWQDFERGLRQKQLASIIEPRPWWLGLNILLGKVPASGWVVSSGAAALLAIMALSSGSQTGPGSSPSGSLARVDSEVSAHSAAPAIHTPAPLLAAATPAASSLVSAAVPPGEPSSAFSSVSSPDTALASTQPGSLSAPTSLDEQALARIETASTPVVNDASLLDAAIEPARAPLAEAATASLSPLPSEADTFLGWAQQRLDFLPAFFDPPGPAGHLVSSTQPDAQPEIKPANPRHARLLARALDDADTEKSLASVRDQVVHRLADGEELYASVTRLGVRGDRLSLRF